ncbi:MAG: hypothetical protein FOGNACKC_01106 [Anaerolineae bacterium]|nr:hypothetical protein [Anaerolineae bacterium]
MLRLFYADTQQTVTFRLLVGYRWISLLLPLIWLFSPRQPAAAAIEWAALVIAASLTLYLTVTTATTNRLLLRFPALLGLDLLVSLLLVGFTGLERSPYYLYSLAPILAAAFFFRVRGGVLAATVYSGLYLLTLLLPHPGPIDVMAAIGQIISFFLIGAIFGYPAHLLQQLEQTHFELARKNIELTQRNRDLNLVRELSLVMQSSIDPAELQESILRGLVHELGYPRAVIGLYDEALDAVSSWITLDAATTDAAAKMSHVDLVSLKNEAGPLARAIKGKLVVEISSGEPPTAVEPVNRRLVTAAHYIILPLSLRGITIGVIVVDGLPADQRLSQVDRLSLDNLATHAGVALGSMRLCIDRAQQTAITEERNRIAADLHDNVSQILYGLAYGLQACSQIMPGSHQLQSVLGKLHHSVTEAQALIRQAIFSIRSDEITSDTFVGGLHRRLRLLCPDSTTALRIDLPGNFDGWPAPVRSGLFQIAQEALANAAKHARARHIVVKLIDGQNEVEMRISDDGDGFDPAAVDQTGHLGLSGMAERASLLNGTFEVISTFGEGTLLVARIPCHATETVLAGSG